MTANGILQILLFIAVVIALAKPLGTFMAKVFAGERTWLHRVLRPVETAIYKLCGIDEAAEQHWTRYAGSLLVFSAVSLLFTYLIMRLQRRRGDPLRHGRHPFGDQALRKQNLLLHVRSFTRRPWQNADRDAARPPAGSPGG